MNDWNTYQHVYIFSCPILQTLCLKQNYYKCWILNAHSTYLHAIYKSYVIVTPRSDLNCNYTYTMKYCDVSKCGIIPIRLWTLCGAHLPRSPPPSDCPWLCYSVISPVPSHAPLVYIKLHPTVLTTWNFKTTLDILY